MSKIRRSKDEGFKKIFTNKTNIHWFITTLLSEFIPCEIGLDDIEVVATESINKQWKARRTDMVYKIKYKDAFICLLLEFQNTKDELFHCRIFEYMLLIQKKICCKQSSSSSNTRSFVYWA